MAARRGKVLRPPSGALNVKPKHLQKQIDLFFYGRAGTSPAVLFAQGISCLKGQTVTRLDPSPLTLDPRCYHGSPRQQTVCGPRQEDGEEHSSQSDYREFGSQRKTSGNIWCLTARNQEKTGSVCNAKHLLTTKLADSESLGDYGGSRKLLIVVFCAAVWCSYPRTTAQVCLFLNRLLRMFLYVRYLRFRYP